MPRSVCEDLKLVKMVIKWRQAFSRGFISFKRFNYLNIGTNYIHLGNQINVLFLFKSCSEIILETRRAVLLTAAAARVSILSGILIAMKRLHFSGMLSALWFAGVAVAFTAAQCADDGQVLCIL